MVFKDYLKIKFYDLKSFIFDEMITQYIRNGLDINGASKIYELMIKKSLTPSRKSLNIMLNAYFELNQFVTAFRSIHTKAAKNLHCTLHIFSHILYSKFSSTIFMAMTNPSQETHGHFLDM